MPKPTNGIGKDTVISGSQGNDTLFSIGQPAVLRGGNGDDTYVIDDTFARIDERKNGGHDQVYSTVNIALEDNVEDVTLTGTEDLWATGNDLDNVMTGNDGDNTLAGGIGDDVFYESAGSDVLDGSDGSDTVAYSGNVADYTIERVGDDIIVRYGDAWADLLTGIETILFADTEVTTADIGTPPPAALSAQDDNAETNKGSEVLLSVLENDIGNGLTVRSVTPGELGNVALNTDGTITYRPVETAVGTDRFSYTVEDQYGQTATAWVTVAINDVNTTPQASDDAYQLSSGTTLEGAESLLANDSDADGDTLRVVGLGNTADPGTQSTQFQTTTTAGGMVTVASDGSFTYTPDPSFSGQDSFTYHIADDQGGIASATVTLDVLPSAPQAVADSAVTDEDSSVIIHVLDNDSGDGLWISAVTNGAFGTVTINEDQTLTYQPEADAFGTDGFSYTVTDAQGVSVTNTVAIDVLPQNDGPVAGDDSFQVDASQTFLGDSVLANDTDIDGDQVQLLDYDTATAAGGTVSMSTDGTFSYTAPDGFSGDDSFGYSIGDGQGGTDTATVALSVTSPDPVPDPAPTPEPDAVPYYVDALLYGGWYRVNAPDPLGTPDTVTFAFLDQPPDYYSDGAFVYDGFRELSEQQKQATLDIISMIESYTNLTFVEVPPDQAEMTFGLANLPGAQGVSGLASADGTGNTASDVWLDADYAGATFDAGSPQYETLMHEIGHALGMRHPDLPEGEDSAQYTVMSGAFHPTMADSATSYQVYDIAALQHLYGTNDTSSSGDDVYSFDDLNDSIETIWDAGGNDTMDMSTAGYGVNIDLNAGSFSTVSETGTNNIAIAFGTDIENAIGGDFDDRLAGNDGDNELTGADGSDTFVVQSGWGRDTITDFTRGSDIIQFENTGLTMDDLVISLTDTGTVVTAGEDQIMLNDVYEVSEEDFLF